MNTKKSPQAEDGSAEGTGETARPSVQQFSIPGIARDEYTDERALWEWQSKYPKEARRSINKEAWFLASSLAAFLILSGFFLGIADHTFEIPLYRDEAALRPPVIHLQCRLFAVFMVGCLGGITFSIKWLVHAAAVGRWHLDRRYWRLFVPFLGGVYACVVLTLFDVGLVLGRTAPEEPSIARTAALAFLVGYFSDGVSGLLSNVASAVFGTLEKK